MDGNLLTPCGLEAELLSMVCIKTARSIAQRRDLNKYSHTIVPKTTGSGHTERPLYNLRQKSTGQPSRQLLHRYMIISHSLRFNPVK